MFQLNSTFWDKFTNWLKSFQCFSNNNLRVGRISAQNFDYEALSIIDLFDSSTVCSLWCIFELWKLICFLHKSLFSFSFSFSIFSFSFSENQVERSTSDPGHAFSRFTTGSRQTLEISHSSDRNLRYELFTFYKTNYSGNLVRKQIWKAY